MRKYLFILSIPVITCLLLSAGCKGDKNTSEACLYETSLNLDKGNYDAVLASPCATAMQLGAAWFGKAGFDIVNVINGLIDASSTKSNKSDLSIYMTSVVGTVTSATIGDLDSARTQYKSVPPADAAYQDAQFYVSLTDLVKSLSIIKTTIPGAFLPDGTLNLTCDRNSNGVPDAADATACALLAANNISTGTTFTCQGAVYSRSTPTDITLTDSALHPVTGIYSGLAVSITGTGPSCPSNTYNRLLFKDAANNYWLATTTEETCTASDSRTYHCPLGGTGTDYVATINASIGESVASLATAITGTNRTDVQRSIYEMRTKACCSGGTPCSTPVCTSQTLADYLENNLK